MSADTAGGPEIVAAIERANEAAKSARGAWIALMSISAYLFTILVSVEHTDILLLRPLRLPIVGTTVSLDKFYVFAPLLLLITFAWTVTAHVILSHRLAAVERALGSGSDKGRDALSPYLVVQSLAGPRYDAVSTVALAVAKWGMVMLVPMFVLLYFQGSYLPSHAPVVLWWHRFCILAAVLLIVGTGLFARAAAPDSGALVRFQSRLPHVALGGLALALSFGLLTGIDERWRPELPPLIGDRADLASRGPVSLFSRNLILPLRDLAGIDPDTRLILRQRDLRYANFTGATLDWADLSGADLRGANLRTARLNGVTAQGADFLGADLYGVIAVAGDFTNASFAATNLGRATLSGASLRNADFYAASLWSAQAQNADFRGAVFTLTDFRNGAVTGARAPGSDPANWAAGVDLSGARYAGTSMSTQIVDHLRDDWRRVPVGDRLLLESRLDGAFDRAECPACRTDWTAAIDMSEDDKVRTDPRVQATRLAEELCKAGPSRDHLINGIVHNRILPPFWGRQADAHRRHEDRPSPVFDQYRLAEALLSANGTCPGRAHLSAGNRGILQDVLAGRPPGALDGLAWVDTAPAAAEGLTVGAGGTVAVSGDDPVPVYGIRDRDCGNAPDFRTQMELLVGELGLSMPAEAGVLADGGVSRRQSRRCGGEVDVRVVVYRPRPGYTGTFELDFFGDLVKVTVEP